MIKKNANCPKITVIVPIYNKEKFLQLCVNSILKQTYSNMEIILVDDGSTDKSGYYCDTFQKDDARIKVIHKKNGGLSSARNVGLEIMTGKYVTFVDSDDFVLNGYIEYLLYLTNKYNSGVAICNEERFRFDKNGNQIILANPYRKTNNEEEVFTAENAISSIFYQNYFDASACGKLFCSDFFHDERFPEGIQYEDISTTYKIISKSKKVVFSRKKLYYYQQFDESIVHSTFNINKMSGINSVELAKNGITNLYPNLIKAAECRCLGMYFHLLFSIPYGTYELEKKIIWQKLIKCRKTVILDSHARKKNRLAALFSYFGLDFTYKLGRLIQNIL